MMSFRSIDRISRRWISRKVETRMDEMRTIMDPMFEQQEVVERIAKLSAIRRNLILSGKRHEMLQYAMVKLGDTKAKLYVSTGDYDRYSGLKDYDQLSPKVMKIMISSLRREHAEATKKFKNLSKENAHHLGYLCSHLGFLTRICGFTGSKSTKLAISCIIDEQIAKLERSK